MTSAGAEAASGCCCKQRAPGSRQARAELAPVENNLEHPWKIESNIRNVRERDSEGLPVGARRSRRARADRLRRSSARAEARADS
jgi:hypothetical protein